MDPESQLIEKTEQRVEKGKKRRRRKKKTAGVSCYYCINQITSNQRGKVTFFFLHPSFRTMKDQLSVVKLIDSYLDKIQSTMHK